MKNIDTTYTPRSWQLSSREITKRCNRNEGSNVIPVNACVGSGKTEVASYAIGDFIKQNFDKKTFQVFVTPRIKLCKQQADSLKRDIETELGLEEGEDYDIARRDCSVDSATKFDPKHCQYSKHLVLVICDKSLWGVDKKASDPEWRFHSYLRGFKKFIKEGYLLGNIVFDEAHNFEQDQEKIFGEKKSLHKLFKNVILMSGTPSAFQKKLTNDNPENVCQCVPKTAMDNGWICRPSLNLVNCGKDMWPNAVRAVLNREIDIWKHGNKLFKPVILVNFTAIQKIWDLRSTPWFKERIGKEFHFISIHSDKALEKNDGSIVDITADIDGVSCNSSDAYEKIEQIDKGGFDDDLPIIVAQVEMIGEGINVSSFNAVITSSSSDKTAMQQIGRAVRNRFVKKTVLRQKKITEMQTVVKEITKPRAGFFNRLFGKMETSTVTEIVPVKKTVEVQEEHVFSKVQDGHANVYVINDNLESITNLIVSLSENHSLTDNCYTWGQKLDGNDGSVKEVLEEAEACKMQKSHWVDIDANTDPEIKTIIGNANDRLLDVSIAEWQDEDIDGNGVKDSEDFKRAMDQAAEDGTVEAITGKKSGIGVTYNDLYDTCFDAVRKWLQCEINREIWKKDRKTALNVIFGDSSISEFFNTHLSEKTLERLGRK